ncbi:MAG TPA: hypothetical protein P5044_04350 [bacterium]|nr:hypothetical protein [bacterium]
MKRSLIIMITVLFALFMLSCSDEKKSVTDDETASDNEISDNETADETADETSDSNVTEDNNNLEDNENTNDSNIITDEENTDSVVETDENINNDSTVETDEELIDEDSEMNDEHGEGEMPDEDRVKPEPVDCGEGFVGLTIRVSYNNGTENVEGGGTVTRNPAGTATEDPNTTCYTPNTDVALTVVPDTNFDFSQWKGKGAGSITGTYPDFSIKVVNTITLRAEFVAK